MPAHRYRGVLNLLEEAAWEALGLLALEAEKSASGRVRVNRRRWLQLMWDRLRLRNAEELVGVAQGHHLSPLTVRAEWGEATIGPKGVTVLCTRKPCRPPRGPREKASVVFIDHISMKRVESIAGAASRVRRRKNKA